MAAPDTHYLFYAIDGTGSADWRPAQTPAGYSHVHRMYQNFNPVRGSKAFQDGPGSVGTDVDNLIDDGINWIKALVEDHKKKDGCTFRPAVNACSANLRPSYGIEIVLIGHSRGATIAGDMARRIGKELMIGVYFLGLFDAVDRSWNSEGGTVENVELTAHAVRNPSMPSERGPSRSSFGNTFRSSNGLYHEQMFNTSHGGVGGAPDLDFEKVAAFGDASCAGPSKADLNLIEWNKRMANGNALAVPSLSLVGPHARNPGYGSGGFSTVGTHLLPGPTREAQLMGFADEARRLKERRERLVEYSARCAAQSKEVYRWMVTQAASAGLPVS